MHYKKIIVEIEGQRYALVPLDPPTSRTPLREAGIASLGANALITAGIEYLEQVLEMSEADILRIGGVGRKTLYELRVAVAERDWRIGQFRRQ